MKAHVISIGTELTTGQSVDTNSAWLSQQLAELGIVVEAHATIDDDLEPIRLAIQRATEAAGLVLITGGLGPTEDDLSRQALAAAMGVDLELHEPSLERIRKICEMFKRRMPESNRIQAMVPAGATVIENTRGTAPGIRARLNDADVFVMPGVPREMKVMFERDVLVHLAEAGGGRVILKKVIRTYGAGESSVAEKIADLMKRGRNPLVGTTAQETIIGVRIVARGESRAEAQQLLDEESAEIRKRLGSLGFGEDEDTPEKTVAALLTAAGKTAAEAQSGPGRVSASRLTGARGTRGSSGRGSRSRSPGVERWCSWSGRARRGRSSGPRAKGACATWSPRARACCRTSRPAPGRCAPTPSVWRRAPSVA